MNVKQAQSDAPSGPVPASELIMDYRLLMICGQATAGAGGASAVWTLRQTNPITLYVVVVVLLGHYICKVGRRRRKTKPIRAEEASALIKDY